MVIGCQGWVGDGCAVIVSVSPTRRHGGDGCCPARIVIAAGAGVQPEAEEGCGDAAGPDGDADGTALVVPAGWARLCAIYSRATAHFAVGRTGLLA